MMNARTSAVGNYSAGRTRRDSSENRGKQQVPTTNIKRTKPASLDVVVDNRRTTIVTVETKGRKGGSIMVSSGSAGRKSDEKKASGGNADCRGNNWPRALTEENPALKEGLQKFAGRIQSSGHAKHASSARRDAKGVGEMHKMPKNNSHDHVILDEIPVKQPAKKSSKPSISAVPSSTTVASSMGTVYIVDVGVQCGFDSNDQFSKFNPVTTLEFLMREMEALVRDQRSSEILTDMEKALYRIPRELGEPSQADMEARAKLEMGCAELEVASKKVEARCTTLREEKEQLQQQVERQSIALEEAHQFRKNLENANKQLNAALIESQQRERSMESKLQRISVELNESSRTISDLKEKNKGMQMLQKLITDLRHERDAQTELAQQNYMEAQYSKIENEKLVTLSSYKDKRLLELQTALKYLQNHITAQLVHIREAGERAKAANDHQISFIHGGAACSSPTSSSSVNSLAPAPGVILSEISLSTVERLSDSSALNKTSIADSKRHSTCINGSFDDTQVNGIREKTQLEFISLPGGDSSHTISLSQRKDDESKAPSFSDKKNERRSSAERKIEESPSAPNLADRETRNSMHRRSVENNEDSAVNLKTRKSSSSDEKQRPGINAPSVDRASGDPADIKQQFQNMFEDIRRQSKFPIHVQSPPRSYPNPDWSDNTLSVVSGHSGTNIV